MFMKTKNKNSRFFFIWFIPLAYTFLAFISIKEIIYDNKIKIQFK